MIKINGYQLTTDFSQQDSGMSRWAFCEKDGRRWFIKEYLSPKYPAQDAPIAPNTRIRRIEECEAFYRERKAFYGAIEHCHTGNLILPRDFFLCGTKYYLVTRRIDSQLDTLVVHFLDEEKKLTLIRSLLYSISKVHENGAVHADLKPSNILLKYTADGYVTGKIIDFDAGFLKDRIPEELVGDQTYLSPEVLLFGMDSPDKPEITEKIDVFALGLLFHLYWTGTLPGLGGGYRYACEAVLDGASLQMDESLPADLRKLIRRMLSKDPEDRPTAAEAHKALLPDIEELPQEHKPFVAAPRKERISEKTNWYVPDDLG